MNLQKALKDAIKTIFELSDPEQQWVKQKIEDYELVLKLDSIRTQRLTPIALEKFITETLWDLDQGLKSYDESVVKFGEMFVRVYESALSEKTENPMPSEVKSAEDDAIYDLAHTRFPKSLDESGHDRNDSNRQIFYDAIDDYRAHSKYQGAVDWEKKFNEIMGDPENRPLYKDSGLWQVRSDNMEEVICQQGGNESFTDFIKRYGKEEMERLIKEQHSNGN